MSEYTINISKLTSFTAAKQVGRKDNCHNVYRMRKKSQKLRMQDLKIQNVILRSSRQTFPYLSHRMTVSLFGDSLVPSYITAITRVIEIKNISDFVAICHSAKKAAEAVNKHIYQSMFLKNRIERNEKIITTICQYNVNVHSMDIFTKVFYFILKFSFFTGD